MDWKKTEASIYKRAKERLQWWKRVFTTGSDLFGYLLGGAVYTAIISGIVFTLSEGVQLDEHSNKLVYVVEKDTARMRPFLKCVYGRVFGNQINAFYSMGKWEPHDESKMPESVSEILMGIPLDVPVVLKHDRTECPESFPDSKWAKK